VVLSHSIFLVKDQSEDSKASLHAGLSKLASIDLISQAYIGQPAGTNREVIDSSYDFSITFILTINQKQDIYQNHPDIIWFC
jgi:hypothetical protein